MENSLDALFGKAGEPVPVVDLKDLKAMRDFSVELKKQHPNGRFGVGMELLKTVCSPGADVSAISYRLSLLGMFEMILKATYPGGHLSDKALKVAAEMELSWMPVGVPQNNMGFDVEVFISQVWAESMTAEK